MVVCAVDCEVTWQSTSRADAHYILVSLGAAPCFAAARQVGVASMHCGCETVATAHAWVCVRLLRHTLCVCLSVGALQML